MDVRIPALKRRARDLAASRPQGAFARDCADELAAAKNIFFDHPTILRMQSDALTFLDEPCGLGVEHAKKVAVDAAAIILSEPSSLSTDQRRELAILAELAGLLHDAMRHEDGHAEKGADLALRMLESYPIRPGERQWIAQAIAFHEDHDAGPEGPEAAVLLSRALHDADLFRFGPDIFSAILWELTECDDWTLEEIVERFGEGERRARDLSSRFLTAEGRRYGPALLAEGLSLAKEYSRMLRQALEENQAPKP